MHNCGKSCCSYSPMWPYMQHLTCDNTDRILYKLLKDNASYAYSIYKYKKSNSGIPSAKANSISRTF